MKKLSLYINEWLIKKKLDKVRNNENIVDVIFDTFEVIHENEEVRKSIEKWVNEYNVKKVSFWTDLEGINRIKEHKDSYKKTFVGFNKLLGEITYAKDRVTYLTGTYADVIGSDKGLSYADVNSYMGSESYIYICKIEE